MVYSLGGEEVRYYLVFSCVVGADVYRYMFRDVVFLRIPFFFSSHVFGAAEDFRSRRQRHCTSGYQLRVVPCDVCVVGLVLRCLNCFFAGYLFWPTARDSTDHADIMQRNLFLFNFAAVCVLRVSTCLLFVVVAGCSRQKGFSVRLVWSLAYVCCPIFFNVRLIVCASFDWCL